MTDSVQIDEAERLNRLRLIRSENVGPITYRQLMVRYRTASAALEALPSLALRGGKGRKLRIQSRDDALREWEQLAQAGGTMVYLGQPDYPPLLNTVEDAPPVLSVLGKPHHLSRRMIAIVGARNASTNGKRLAGQFAQALGHAGFTVTSGLALGIDAAAHSRSLDTGTVAVVAGGVDVIYPRDNTDLYHAIRERGAIISEQPFGMVGQARHFPRRNRIISGMASAVLIVEATLRSGSLISARLAAEQGREVMAIPGSPLDPRARGTNDLIRKGATLIETPEEIVELLRELPSHQLSSPTTPYDPGPMPEPDTNELMQARARIGKALAPTPVAIDDLIRDLQLKPALVAMVLLELELAGLVERHAGGKVSRLAPDTAPSAAAPAAATAQSSLF